MGYQEQWKRDIAYRIRTILVRNPQGRERFRAKIKEFCEEYQACLESQKTEGTFLTEADFDALANDEDEQINDVSPQNIPRDPLRGGEHYERPTTDEQVLRERYAALAVLFDDELEDDRPIIGEQTLYSRLVSKNILQNNRKYDRGFYETALVAITADLQKQTDIVESSPATVSKNKEDAAQKLREDELDRQEQTVIDWDRPDHKVAVVKWIRTEYWKNSKANKAKAIRAALVHFGLPCDYERRVRSEYDRRQKK